MPKFGGGGASCTICTKTVYPAETVQFEKKPYHVECFRCHVCTKKMEGGGSAATYDDQLYCKHCFAKGGFAQKQRTTTWTKKESTGSATASKFGGGGNPCEVCSKTVYPAETVSYEKKVYHPECFQCGKCSKKMVPSGAAQFEEDGVNTLFCSKCFQDGGYSRKQAAQKKTTGSSTSSGIASKFGGGGNPCTVCTKTVYPAESMSFEKKVYHGDCFKCTKCEKKMTPSGAAQFEEDGVNSIYCTKCFQEGGYSRKQAATAKSSGGSGSSNALSSKFGGGGNKCYRCDKTVYPAETVSFEKKAFHQDCFTCLNCDKKCSTSEAEGKKTEDGVDVYCRKCWRELGLGRA